MKSMYRKNAIFMCARAQEKLYPVVPSAGYNLKLLCYLPLKGIEGTISSGSYSSGTLSAAWHTGCWRAGAGGRRLRCGLEKVSLLPFSLELAMLCIASRMPA